MGQVAITLGNRTYRLACNNGEEARLSALAADVKSRVEGLAREFGQVADERLLLMAAVLLADELWDLREAHDSMLSAAAEVLREAANPPSPIVADRAAGAAAAGATAATATHVPDLPGPTAEVAPTDKLAEKAENRAERPKNNVQSGAAGRGRSTGT